MEKEEQNELKSSRRKEIIKSRNQLNKKEKKDRANK